MAGPAPVMTSAGMGRILSSIGHAGNMGEGEGGPQTMNVLELHGWQPDVTKSFDALGTSGTLLTFGLFAALNSLMGGAQFQGFNIQAFGLASLGNIQRPVLPTSILGGRGQGR